MNLLETMTTQGLSLFVVLIVASLIDFRSHIVPNWLVFCGLLLALSLALFSPQPTWGILEAFSGLVVGLFILMPLYLLKMLGAGDVKLLAVVGAFVGNSGIVIAVFFTLIAGGILACLWSVGRYLFSSFPVKDNDLDFCTLEMPAAGCGSLDGELPSVDETDLNQRPTRMPYAAAIAVGGMMAYLGMY